MSIKLKFFLGLLVLIILPQSIGLYMVYSKVMDSVNELENEQILERYSVVNELINLNKRSLESTLTTNTNWSDFRDAVLQENIGWIEDNVNSISTVMTNVDFVATTNLQGKVLSSADAPEEFSEDISGSPAFSVNKEEKIKTGLCRTSKGMALVSIGKIYDNEGQGEPAGNCLFGYYLNKDGLEEIKKAAKADIALYSESGLVSTIDLDIDMMKSEFSSQSKGVMFSKHVEAGQKNIAAYGFINDINNKPVALLYVEGHSVASLNLSGHLKSYVVGLLCTVIVTLLLLAYYQQKNVLGPLARVVKVMQDIASGKLNARWDTKYQSKDEIGQLLEACKEMQNKLKLMLAEIMESSGNVLKASSELSGHTLQTSSAATGTAGAMNQMASTIEELSSRSQTVSRSAIVAADLALSGNAGLKSVSEQMNTINLYAGKMKDMVDVLGQGSRQITGIIEIITGIAEQTNLLALNAAIEAARAGEQGRGFAVVAEEVRKLAEQSASAAGDIARLIKNILSETEKVTITIEESNREVSRGISVVSEVEDSFVKIINTVQDLSVQVREIAAGTEQIAVTVQSVAGMVEEQSAVTQQLGSSTEELASLAENLEKLAGRFDVT